MGVSPSTEGTNCRAHAGRRRLVDDMHDCPNCPTSSLHLPLPPILQPARKFPLLVRLFLGAPCSYFVHRPPPRLDIRVVRMMIVRPVDMAWSQLSVRGQLLMMADQIWEPGMEAKTTLYHTFSIVVPYSSRIVNTEMRAQKSKRNEKKCGLGSGRLCGAFIAADRVFSPALRRGCLGEGCVWGFGVLAPTDV